MRPDGRAGAGCVEVAALGPGSLPRRAIRLLYSADSRKNHERPSRTHRPPRAARRRAAGSIRDARRCVVDERSPVPRRNRSRGRERREQRRGAATPRLARAAAGPAPRAQTSETVAEQATVEAETVLAGDAEPEPASTGLLTRGRVRRRVRYLRRLRELQLRDLGGFVVELQRLGRERPELVREKLTARCGPTPSCGRSSARSGARSRSARSAKPGSAAPARTAAPSTAARIGSAPPAAQPLDPMTTHRGAVSMTDDHDRDAARGPARCCLQLRRSARRRPGVVHRVRHGAHDDPPSAQLESTAGGRGDGDAPRARRLRNRARQPLERHEP